MYTGRGSPPRGKTTTSLLKRARTAPANQSNLTQQTVSSYRLQWDKLRRYLETRFSQDNYPNYIFDFKERKVCGIKSLENVTSQPYCPLLPSAAA